MGWTNQPLQQSAWVELPPSGGGVSSGDSIGSMEDRIWDHPLIAALVQRDLDLVARREKEAREQDVPLVRSPWEDGAGRQ